MTTKVWAITTTGSGTLSGPADYPGVATSVECIGGGGSSINPQNSTSGGSGGGGAYAKSVNVQLPNGTPYTVGAGATTSSAAGGDTWIGHVQFASSICGAKGGSGSVSPGTGAAGGAVSGCIFNSVAYNGGAGGVASTSGGGGGGGAGGIHGDGAHGGQCSVSSGSGGGGGASTGGTPGADGAATAAGGNGGDNFAGSGHGTGGSSPSGAGTAGTAGGGGGGGGSASQGAGGVGGPGTNDWTTDYVNGSSSVQNIGAGGGGGGQGAGSNASNTPSGGNYGGGGGGCNSSSSTFGHGGDGLIVITYTLQPIITVAPFGVRIMEGQLATFSVTATASAGSLTYQWQDNRTGSFANCADGTGATSATYTTPPELVSASGRQYQCVLTDSNGSRTTLPVAMIVVPYDTIEDPRIRYPHDGGRDWGLDIREWF